MHLSFLLARNSVPKMTDYLHMYFVEETYFTFTKRKINVLFLGTYCENKLRKFRESKKHEFGVKQIFNFFK